MALHNYLYYKHHDAIVDKIVRPEYQKNVKKEEVEEKEELPMEKASEETKPATIKKKLRKRGTGSGKPSVGETPLQADLESLKIG